ncbi:hypothetical protein U1Q18_042521 [Sarracenia purpurea var. burkii]
MIFGRLRRRIAIIVPGIFLSYSGMEIFPSYTERPRRNFFFQRETESTPKGEHDDERIPSPQPTATSAKLWLLFSASIVNNQSANIMISTTPITME